MVHLNTVPGLLIDIAARGAIAPAVEAQIRHSPVALLDPRSNGVVLGIVGTAVGIRRNDEANADVVSRIRPIAPRRVERLLLYPDWLVLGRARVDLGATGRQKQQTEER